MRLQLAESQQQLLARLSVLFSGYGVAAWASGGFLRDAMLGRTPRDVDITLSGDALKTGQALAAELDAHFAVLDADRLHARITLRQGGGTIDLTSLRAPAIESDLLLRDYTVDAMAGEVSAVAAGEFDLIDPAGGAADLTRRTLRVISEEAFVADPLRLLRGPRLAAELEFEVDAGTASLVRRHAPAIEEASCERQRGEVMRIFSTGAAGRGVRLTEELGLFPFVFPEMEVTRGVEQPKEHYHDVLGHSLAAVECLDGLLSEVRPRDARMAALWSELWEALAWCEGLRDHFRETISGYPRSALVKLCGLLHDIGKPATKSFQEDGRMRFFGHSDVGAELAAVLMRRLRFSSRETAIVRRMIQAHLRPMQLAQGDPPSRRAVYRFFRDTGEAGIDTLFLSLADHMATRGPMLSEAGYRRHVALIDYVLRMRFREEGVVSPPRLVDGETLMSELGLRPGKMVGQLLEAVREAQAAGEVTTAEEAVALARRELEKGAVGG